MTNHSISTYVLKLELNQSLDRALIDKLQKQGGGLICGVADRHYPDKKHLRVMDKSPPFAVRGEFSSCDVLETLNNSL